VAPLAAYLPTAAMAAVLFLVAWGLFDFEAIRTITRSSRSETAVLVATFIATLVLHLEMAIFAGVLVSLVLFLNRTSQPSLRSLLPDVADANRRFIERPSNAAECPQLKILRVEGTLYFGATHHVGEYLHYLAEHHPEQKHLLLMARSMNFVDVAGAELLAAEAIRRRTQGGALHFHGLREGASQMLRKSPFAEAIGCDAIHPSKRAAIANIVGRLDRDVCRRCQVRVFEECAQLPSG
jgi:SulP family sulfate permease